MVNPDKIRSYLEKLGVPGRDVYDLPTSEGRFPDGAHYRIEVPGIQTPTAIEALIAAADEYGVVINRITETQGAMRLTDKEIEQMIEFAKSYKAELILSPGPRAIYDIGASVQTPEGARISYRLRGSDQLVRALLDVFRVIELGCRGIMCYDEGLLWVLSNMRKDGMIPKETKFKVSAHCGYANPASIKLLADMGADSVNPVRDLPLPIIAAIRRAVKCDLDIHVDNPRASGGFIRTYEAPDFVRVAAPVYLKSGASVFERHAWSTTAAEAKLCAKQASLAHSMVVKYYPEAVQSKPGAKGLAIPK